MALEEVIVVGDAAPIVTPVGVEHVTFEFTVEIQNRIVASLPGKGTLPLRVAEVPAMEEAPVAVAVRLRSTWMVTVSLSAA